MADNQRKLDQTSTELGSKLSSVSRELADIVEARATLNIQTDATHIIPKLSNITITGCREFYYQNTRIANGKVDIQGFVDLHLHNRVATLTGKDFTVTNNDGKTLVKNGRIVEASVERTSPSYS